jgi:hypothetical protein
VIRILVTGSREWTDNVLFEQTMLGVLDMFARRAAIEVPKRKETFTIVHGACPTGIDAIADDWARILGFTREPHPADWDRHGKRAGPLRNYAMVEAGADFCVAFPLEWPSGTEDAYRKAIRARIPTLVIAGTRTEP